MFEPFFSIIIAVYNKEAYIDDCMSCLDAQTFRDFEIIFIDDGSTDRSLDVLKKHAQGNDKVTLLTQENQGPSGARNSGIDAAKGEYLVFLDSDDTLTEDALEHLHDRLTQDRPDVLLFDAKVILEAEYADDDSIGRVAGSFDRRYKRSHSYDGVYPGIELFSLMKEDGDYLPNACFMTVSNKYANRTGLRFVPGILHEDNLFSFSALIFAERACHMHEEIYLRRVVENSIMTGKTTTAHVDGYFTTYVKMMEILEGFQEDDRYAKYLDVIADEIRSIRRHTRRSFLKLTEEDKHFYQKYPYTQKLLFEGLIADYCEKAAALKETRQALKKERKAKDKEADASGTAAKETDSISKKFRNIFGRDR